MKKFIPFLIFVIFFSGVIYSDIYAQEQGELPDFTIESPIFDEDTLSFIVSNIGTASAGTFTGKVQWLRENGSPAAPAYIPLSIDGGLAAGASRTISWSPANTFFVYFTTNAPADAARLLIALDDQSAFAELNENNNSVEIVRITSETTGEELTQTDEEIVEDEVEEEITTTDAEVAVPQHFDPKILPGNPLYFFKNTGREIKSFFTFDIEKKVNLRLRYATEKILEANKLADRGEDKRIAPHLQNYEKDFGKIQNLINGLEEKDPKAAQVLAGKSLERGLRHQVLIGKFEGRASTDDIPNIKEAREKIIGRIGQTVAGIDDQDKVGKIVEKSLSFDGSPFKVLRNLEVLKLVEQKVPEQAKDAIIKAQENSLRRFAGQIEALSDERRGLFSEYAEKMKGDEVVYLKVLDSSTLKQINEKAEQNIAAAKEKILERAGEKMEEITKEKPAAAAKVFSSLTTGNIEDIRIIKDLETRVDAKTAEKLRDIKSKALEKIIDFIKEDKGALEKEVAKLSDVKQIIALEEIKAVSSEETEKNIVKFQKAIAQTITKEIKEKKTDATRQNAAAKVLDTTPQSIKIINNLFGDKEVKEVLLKKQFEKISGQIEKTSGTNFAENLQRELTNKETRQIVEKFQPKIIQKAQEKTKIGILAKRAESLAASAKKLSGPLSKAIGNARKVISLLQTAQDTYFETHTLLIRLRELADEASNDEVGDRRRQYLQDEFSSLMDEINTLSETSQFNGRPLLSGLSESADMDIQVGLDREPAAPLIVYLPDLRPSTLGLDKISLLSKESAQNSIKAITGAIGKVNNAREQNAKTESKVESALDNLSKVAEDFAKPEPTIQAPTPITTPEPKPELKPKPIQTPTPIVTPTPTPEPIKEITPSTTIQCSDGIDNDKDGYIDLKDQGCADSKDDDEADPSVPVVKPIISSFIASPTAISKGQSVSLSWAVSDATNIILSPTKETITASGKKVVTPTLTTTYTITATNSAGSVTASVTVTVK